MTNMKEINIYFSVIDLSILKKLRSLRLKHVKLWFSSNLPTKYNKIVRYIKDANFIEKNCRIGSEYSFHQWVSESESVCRVDSCLKYLIWRHKEYNSDFIIIDKKDGTLTFFVDVKNNESFPDAFYTVDCFNSFDALFTHLDYCFLLDYSKFRRTSKVQRGGRVYKEISTNYFWYLDTLHRNHYEVFDKSGKHIGEATLSGEIDKSKADKAKTIDCI